MSLKTKHTVLKKRIKARSKSHDLMHRTKKERMDFVRKFNKEQQATVNVSDCNTKLVNKQRLVFISITGLFRTYKQCPLICLYPAIFILPICSKWIHSKKHRNKIEQLLFPEEDEYEINKVAVNHFIELLKWKHSQNLLFAAKDYDQAADDDGNQNAHWVAPFWQHLSKQLSAKYNPLCFDMEKWRQHNSEYDVSFSSILCELCVANLRFKQMQEIIHKSNPNVLNPVVSYSQHQIGYVQTKCKYVQIEIKDDPNQKGTWWISQDYEL